MYFAILALLLGAGAALLLLGIARRRPAKAAAGALLAAATLVFFSLLSFWGELLWFEAVGFGQRFWTEVLAKAGMVAVGALFGASIVYLLTYSVPAARRTTRRWVAALAGASCGLWGLTTWDEALQYLHRVSTGVQEPIFHRDVGFYLFSLPMYDALFRLFLMVAIIALLGNVAGAFALVSRRRGSGQETELPQPEIRPDAAVQGYHSLYTSAAVCALVLAWGKYLARYHLMHSTRGVVNGPGWTDVHVMIPAYWLTMVVTALLGLVVALPWLRTAWRRLLSSRTPGAPLVFVSDLGSTVAVGAAVWVVALVLVPGLFQWLHVEPNEITIERPYISHNIAFTRRAFQLDKTEDREFPATETLTREAVQRDPGLFANVRLWDWRALKDVYQQFQEIRLYYRFADVDIDRYTIGQDYRQMMVAARELELGNLPEQSQTFVNRRFKYTHGYGITLSDVSEFTTEGLPNLLIRDLPAKVAHPDLALERPQIYYGELTYEHAVVNSAEQEFDYPRGDQNVYIRYDGQGGVRLASLWRKFLYGWKFDGTRFLMSSYPQPASRVMFHRQVRERVRHVAPFLAADEDPYIVLVNGRLYWIIDTYVASRHYPYSQVYTPAAPGAISNVNYVRNSVKAVVDAYEGTVDLYVFEQDDAMIQVWDRIFPGLLQPSEQMPGELRAHVRYPADMLEVQGAVYAKYHMTDPAVFYNQEDLWVRATEKYYGYVQAVQPYYIMWEPPGADQLEFILMLPFTPKERQVMIGWIAGMCDGENYGRLLVFKFPKEKRVLGTQQVETKIDQDPFLSAQLSLWDQRGSSVIRGNVLVIPVGETLLYVEPIYLRAETAAYPELRLVAVMHGDNLSYAESFDEALAGLFTEAQPAAGVADAALQGLPFGRLAQRANDAFARYLEALGAGQFERSAAALARLQQTLERLTRQAGQAGPSQEGL